MSNEKGGGKKTAKGQSATHLIRNPATNETKEIRQDEWAEYRTAGWKRIDDGTTVETDEPTEGTTDGSSDPVTQ